MIHNELNGTNINENCGSTHIEVLQQFVKEKGELPNDIIVTIIRESNSKIKASA